MPFRRATIGVLLAVLPSAASAYDLCVQANVSTIVYVQVGTGSPRSFVTPDAPCRHVTDLGDVKAGTAVDALKSCNFSIAPSSGSPVTVHYSQKSPSAAGLPPEERCLR